MGHKKQNDIWKQCYFCKPEGCPHRATNSRIERTDCDQFGVLKMAKSPPALINHQILVWGRESIGLTLEDAARKSGISINTLS